MTPRGLHTYTRSILVFDALAIAMFSLYAFRGWQSYVFTFITRYFFLELLGFIVTLLLYYSWYRQLKRDSQDSGKFDNLGVWLFAFFIMAAYGFGMRQGTDQLHKFYDGPAAFYYDEILSHQLIFMAAFGMLVIFSKMQFLAPVQPSLSKGQMFFIVASGAVLGVLGGLSVLEGHCAWPGLIFLSIFCLFLVKKNKKGGPGSYPLVLYLLGSSGVILMILLAWLMVYHGFPEPHTVGLANW